MGKLAITILLLGMFSVGCAGQSRPSSGSQDDDVPVLKRRPPASDTGQQPSAPPPASTPQQPPANPQPNPPTETTSAAPSGASATPTSHDHHAQVMRHGAEAMGFSQETTTHKFILTHSGGAVRVTANDPDDSTTVGQINVHLRDVASQFARGDFSAPEHTHGQMPPGVPIMQQLRRKIIYTAHAIDRGGELIITSADPRAIEAIHQFLEFQIRDHQTGDPTAVR